MAYKNEIDDFINFTNPKKKYKKIKFIDYYLKN